MRKNKPVDFERMSWEHTVEVYTGNRESNLVSWLSAGAVILFIIVLFATT